MSNNDDSEYVRELVCQYFCDGKTASEIATLINEQQGTTLTQKDPYRILQQEHGKFRYVSARHNALSDGIEAAFSDNHFKPRVTVTITDVKDELLRRSAEAIWKIIQQSTAASGFQTAFRVGFSGGHTLRSVARRLREVLNVPRNPAACPEKIVFIALVSGIDTEAAGTDPTSFFTYLAGREDRATPVCETEFALFHAPPIIRPSEMEKLRRTEHSDQPTISGAFERARRPHLIVTSAAEFDDPHSQLQLCYTHYSKETYTRLSEEHCIGDMLWQPLNASGVMDTSAHPFRSLTLIELAEIPNLIANGTRVLLTLGPCAGAPDCDRLRTRILYTILRHRLVTDVVLDRKTGVDLLNLDSRIKESANELLPLSPPDRAKRSEERGVKRVETLLTLEFIATLSGKQPR
jgi:DNA-binding transcriptional regulator LsrR (DeoR family)